MRTTSIPLRQWQRRQQGWELSLRSYSLFPFPPKREFHETSPKIPESISALFFLRQVMSPPTPGGLRGEVGGPSPPPRPSGSTGAPPLPRPSGSSGQTRSPSGRTSRPCPTPLGHVRPNSLHLQFPFSPVPPTWNFPVPAETAEARE